MEMTQAPKLWVPIVATVIFGGAATTTWMWVTSDQSGFGNNEGGTQRKAVVAKSITPNEADTPTLAPQGGLAGTSMTVDDKFVYIYSGSKLMKVDKESLQIVNSANLITAPPIVPSVKPVSHQSSIVNSSTFN